MHREQHHTTHIVCLSKFNLSEPSRHTHDCDLFHDNSVEVYTSKWSTDTPNKAEYIIYNDPVRPNVFYMVFSKNRHNVQEVPDVNLCQQEVVASHQTSSSKSHWQTYNSKYIYHHTEEWFIQLLILQTCAVHYLATSEDVTGCNFEQDQNSSYFTGNACTVHKEQKCMRKTIQQQ